MCICIGDWDDGLEYDLYLRLWNLIYKFELKSYIGYASEIEDIIAICACLYVRSRLSLDITTLCHTEIPSPALNPH
jgi:hypothetical protein